MEENNEQIMKEEKNIKFSNLIYLIGIALFCLKFFAEKSTLITVNDNILAVAICLCFFQKMILQKYTKKQFVITIISGIISVYASFITKEYIIFYFYLSIFASKNIDINSIIKICFWTTSILLSISTITYIVRMLMGINVPITLRNDGSRRYSFYLNHPNMYAGVVLWLSAMILYLKYYTIKKVYYILIIIVNILTFIVTDSRTSIIAFALLMLLFVICKKINDKNKYLKIGAKYSFLIMGITTILLSVWYLRDNNNNIIMKLNELFSQRIFLFSTSIEKYGISFLPRNIDLTEKVRWESGAIRELYIDSIYARAFIKYGIGYLIYLFYFCTKLINKKTTNREVPFVILFATIGMMEKYIMFPVIAFPLFFYKFSLWNEEKKEEGRIKSE